MPLSRFIVLRRVKLRTVLRWLQQQSPVWPMVLGMVLGLGVCAGALFGIGGIIGVGLCLAVGGAVCWLAKDAEPILVAPSVWSGQLPPPAAAEPDRGQPSVPESSLVESPDMVFLQGGTFLMGSPDTDGEADADEKPQHEVTVAGFWISTTPITRQLYRAMLGTVLSEWQRDADDDRLPANYVSWFEAVEFCNALSVHTGLQPCYRITDVQVEWEPDADGYRLPTEAEWEYACRAGTTSRWFCGDDPDALDRYAWFTKNSDNEAHPVGEKIPNPWGLYDMSGNVYEWCWDWYGAYGAETVHNPAGLESGSSRVLRGGAAWGEPWDLRSARRNGLVPDGRYFGLGFRCVRRPRH